MPVSGNLSSDEQGVLKPDHDRVMKVEPGRTRGGTDEHKEATLSRATPQTLPSSTAGALLDSLLILPPHPSAPTASRWRRFLESEDIVDSLKAWFGERQFETRQQLLRELNRQIGQIDRLLNQQLNVILHHPQFQKLESGWRGLMYLVEKAWREDDADQPSVKIRVLNASWKDLQRDFSNALEFDQSELFRKVYEQEFGTAGGEPFGVVVANYELDASNSSCDSVSNLSQVAAAAFCPFIINASPRLFGLDDFIELERRLEHEKTFGGLEHLRWQGVRRKEDARFLAITLPNVLMRLPYSDSSHRVDGFQFREEVASPDRSRYLWGGAAFALGGTLIRAFANTGWLADIQGVHRDVDGGGLVTDLPVHCFTTERMGIAPRSSTDVIITDELEKRLSDLGFISLCDCQDTEYSAFYSTPSMQQPQKYDRQLATTNARISAMLHSMLCASRFAHYLKVISRDRIGGSTDPKQLERFLQQWVSGYVTPDTDASPEVRARFPLREARVRVSATPGQAGVFEAVMQLVPHYEIEGISTGIRLVARLAGVRHD